MSKVREMHKNSVLIWLATFICSLFVCACVGISEQAKPTTSPGSSTDRSIEVSQPSPVTTGPIGSESNSFPMNMAMDTLFLRIDRIVVRVDCKGNGFFSYGSGIIVRSDGHILTNAHVIEGAMSITITLSSSEQYPAIATASDPDLDLAILKIGGNSDYLPAADLGSNSDIIIGEEVITAGFPLGQDLPGPVSFSQGIVSALRTLGDKEFIQTDSTINPGNSGGALARKLDAKIIGIITAKVAPQGQVVENIGLAIPIDVIKAYLENNLD